jgi:hypothetical protein
MFCDIRLFTIRMEKLSIKREPTHTRLVANDITRINALFFQDIGVFKLSGVCANSFR